MTTLDQLVRGATAVVAQIVGTDDIAIRLMEMGVTPGVEVELIGSAPLGDPIEVELRGYRLSLRRSEARRVQLQ